MSSDIKVTDKTNLGILKARPAYINLRRLLCHCDVSVVVECEENCTGSESIDSLCLLSWGPRNSITQWLETLSDMVHDKSATETLNTDFLAASYN